MKISIDQEECIECGSCVDECGEIFELKEGAKASIVYKYQAANPAEGEVGKELAECARNAAEVCPVEVIHVQ